MPLPWIKMWLEGLDDPKLTRLSLAERGAWWGLLKLAGRCQAGGRIVSGDAGLEMDEIADALHIKTDDDRQALESMLAKMEKRGSLVWNDQVLLVVHYEERQRIPPSAQPEAVAERVRRYRGRKSQKEPKTPDPMLVERQNRIGIANWERRQKTGSPLAYGEQLTFIAELDKELEEKYGRSVEDALRANES